MKSKMNIKSIIFMAIIGIVSLFFINMSLAANTAKINVETANLRETADENSKILEQLSKNQEVEVVEKQEEWYKVKVSGMTGYIRSDLLDVQEQENTTNEETQTATTQVSAEQTKTEQTSEIKLGKQKIAVDTKLKIVPVITGTDIVEVKKDEEVEVIEIINNWVCVTTQTTKGWIRKEKLQKEEQASNEQQPQTVQQPQKVEETVIKTLYTNTDTVNLRSEPNTSSEIVKKLSLNTAVDVVKEENNWSKVKVDGKEGYISSSLLSDKKQETSRGMETTRRQQANTNTAKTQTETTKSTKTQTATAPVSGRGAEIVEYAKKFIGTPYKYGGSSPTTGFDCSGFTSYVYSNYGISLPRTSGGQAKVGTAVSRSELAPGDLVIYSGHVAIYVGGGQVIHSPRTGKTVCIVPINQAASRYIGARRVI